MGEEGLGGDIAADFPLVWAEVEVEAAAEAKVQRPARGPSPCSGSDESMGGTSPGWLRFLGAGCWVLGAVVLGAGTGADAGACALSFSSHQGACYSGRDYCF